MAKKNNNYNQKSRGTSGGFLAGVLQVAGYETSEEANDGRSNSRDVYKGPHAPYNFVSIRNTVMENPVNAVHNVISDDLYTGTLSYEMCAQTPILVDSGKNSFYLNKEGIPTIPGSTVRGLIRSNAQILSFSSVRGDIDDYNLMYRAVAGGCQKDYYNKVLGQRQLSDTKMTVLEKVHAGYLECKNGKYTIYQPIEDPAIKKERGALGYYVLSERIILEDENIKDGFEYIFDKMQHESNTKFIKKVKKGKTHYEGTVNDNYQPYYEKISYEASNGRVSAIAEPGVYRKTGYVLSTGPMNEKKAFYVIPDIDRSREVSIPKEKMQAAITAFQIDYNRKKNSVRDYIMENEVNFFDLPPEGEVRPIFYIELSDEMLGTRYYFGYTPRLRLMYKHTIQDGLVQEEGKRDFVKTMFGYSDKNESWKSRVFFSDAVLSGTPKRAKGENLILAEPKPTSYLEYLEQKNPKEPKTYNEDDFRLRGIKQYWLKKDTDCGEESDKENVKSVINPLGKGSTFHGEIRFRNLSKEELGLLIWSIRLEKNSQMNIGKAKPYGYGRIKVSNVQLQLQNCASSYEFSTEALHRNPYVLKSQAERDDFVVSYKRFLVSWIDSYRKHKEESIETWPEKDLTNYLKKIPTIRDFLIMKSYIASGKDVEYMPMDKNKADGRNFAQFKQDNVPLPTVQYFYEKWK